MNSSLKKFSESLSSKLSSPIKKTFTAGLWAGTFIALGGICYALLSSLDVSSNLIRLAASVSFSVGLILVIFKKSQLFTGNNLMFISIFKKTISIKEVIKNWALVYIANLCGALFVAATLYFLINDTEVIASHLENIANKKVSYTFSTALLKAVLCNILVCLAVWLGVTLKGKMKKIIGIVLPITAFVFLGFEHSIANMFFIPIGLGVSDLETTKSVELFFKNIIPVTAGNIIGGLIVSTVLILRTSKEKSEN